MGIGLASKDVVDETKLTASLKYMLAHAFGFALVATSYAPSGQRQIGERSHFCQINQFGSCPLFFRHTQPLST